MRACIVLFSGMAFALFASAAHAQSVPPECARYTCASTATSLDQCIRCNMSVGPWTREQSIQWCNRWMSRCNAPGAKGK